MFSFPDLKRLRRKWSRPAEPGAAPEPEPPPPVALLGYIGERSTRHVAGWIHNPADATEHPEFEVVCTLGAERVVARGRADQFDRTLSRLALGDATYGFRVIFPTALTEAERDHLEVRPVATGAAVPLAPDLRDTWEPIRFVAMDIVDNCNLRCPFCLYDYANVHTTNVMRDEVYDKALKLLPLVGPDQFWLSCLHEPTLHPNFIEYITRIPQEYRRKVFFTSNFARRMPNAYYDTLAASGLDHVNISIESRDPAIYERLRKGARHRIFMESWEKLLAACATGPAPPKLRYIIMAYQSNVREIPELIDYLLTERRASNVEVRHTFDEAHIPAEFKSSEYLTLEDWRWLQSQLSKHPVQDVVFAPPPELAAAGEAPPPDTPAMLERVKGVFQIQMFHGGFMAIYPSLAGASSRERPDVVHVNIMKIGDPVDFLMSLSSASPALG